MDGETLVDQIVRSLTFEVVAAPQNVIPIDSSSKMTPVNVKLKVRKKQGTGLRHGVISMPQVDIRSVNRKQEPRERVRLVSSDHTIMDFDVLMEAEFDKGALKNQKKQDLNMIAPPDSQEQDETDKKLDPSPIFVKRNKDIFGKCKPGGCLDPPFGEDRYPYKPSNQKLLPPLKKESTKLRSSSIFKKNIFKKKRKGFQDYAQLDKTDQENKAETDSNLDDTESLTQHSNLLITYPHPSIPKKTQKLDEKRLSKEDDKFNNRNSSDEKSRSSSIDKGSYYVIPKKTRMWSNQSDTHDNKLVAKLNGANITFQNSEFENADNVIEIKPAPEKDSKFIPIPLIVPLNAFTSDNRSNEPKANDETCPEPVLELPLFDYDNVVKAPLAVSDQNASLESETISVSTIKENASNTHTNYSSVQNFAHKEEVEVDDRADFFTFSFEPDSEKNQCTRNDAINSEVLSTSQLDLKSHPLMVDTREKAMIGITDSFKEKPEDIVLLKISEQNNIPYSSEYLKEIWENENDPLKSAADVIFSDNIPNGDTPNSDQNSTISTNSKKSQLLDILAENIQKEHDLSPTEMNSDVNDEPIISLDSKAIPNSQDTSYDSKIKPQDNLNLFYDSNQPSYDYHENNKNITQDLNILPDLPDSRDEQPHESMTYIGTISPTDKEEDPTKKLLTERIEMNKSEDDTETVTIENLIDLKKVRSVSDVSIMGSLYDKDINEVKDAHKNPLPSTKQQINKITSHTSFKLDQLPIKEFTDAFTETTDDVQVLKPPFILKKSFWKIDIALLSYIDDNHERIIKSFDSKSTPQRQENDSVLVAQCYLGSEVNEIKIPVDLENDLNVRMTQKAMRPKLHIADSGQGFVETPKKNNIKTDTTVSAMNISDAIHEPKRNKSDAGSHNNGRSEKDLSNALNKVYEEELLPLQDMIKELRQEIDTLLSYQTKFKEVQMVIKPASRRTRPVRLLHQSKRCSCTKKL